MTEKIYLETFEKCPWSVYLPLLIYIYKYIYIYISTFLKDRLHKTDMEKVG